MSAYPALDRLGDLLAAERRRRALGRAARAAWFLISLHFCALAAFGWLSLRHPFAPGWLEAMAWSFLIPLGIPIAYFLARRAPGNTPEALARELDHANPGAPDPFRTSLSLSNHDAGTLALLDRLLARHLPGLRFPRPPLFPPASRIAFSGGAALLLVAALASGRPGEFLARTAAPWSALRALPSLAFELDGVRTLLAAGDTATVTGTIRNLAPGQGIYAHVITGTDEMRYPVAPGPDGRFAFSRGPADSDFTLAFDGANGRSAPLRFRVVPPPFLTRVRAILHPPAYTRLPPDTLPAGALRFPVLPGTRVEWRAEADRPLRRSGWEFRPAEPPRAQGAVSPESVILGPGKSLSFSRAIRSAVDYVYWLEDEDGIRSRPSLPYRIDAAPDQAPEVELVAPGSDTVLELDGKLSLAFRAKDDFGIASFRLAWKVIADGKPRTQGKRDARDWLSGANAGLAQAVWDVAPLRLKPGEEVEFRLEASDNDTVSGPKTGFSATRRARMPGLQEVVEAVRRREQSAESNLKSAQQLGKRLERKLAREQEAPRDEGPPMLAEYEMNRIMVEDPREHRQRTESALGQLGQALESQERNSGGGGKKEGRDFSQAQAAVREMREFLRASESDLPRGNQGMLPADERRKNLERLTRSQKAQSDKIAALREKLEKTPKGAPDGAQARREMARHQLGELAKELERNLKNQADLAKLLQEQEAQAKAKSDLMDQAIQEQMKMAEDMKAAQDDLRKAAESQARNGLLSPELIEKMKQVQDLLREVLPDSLQKLMEDKLRGQQVDEKELKDKLRQMLEKQAELAESLDRAMAMLEQLKDRKRMEELRRTLGGLQERERELERELRAGKAGASQDAEQKAIAQEARKALSDFAAQAEARKGLQEAGRALKGADAERDMQEVRNSLAEAKGKEGSAKASAASAAAKSAGSAAEKLGRMGETLGQAMQSMGGNAPDLGEASEILQESLALSRLQWLIRGGSARRMAEGWQADEATLYAGVARTAAWLQERVRALSAQVPFLGDGLNAQARGLAMSTREASRVYSWEIAEKAMQHNQNLSRELLKLLKMAQNAGGGGGQGSGGPGGEGQGGEGGGGDLSSALKGMSGKQMAINQATYQLLKAMMEGRAPGPQGGSGEGGKQGSGQGSEGSGQGQGQGKGEGQGEGEGEGEGGNGSLGSLANREGELGERLESMAESQGDEGDAAGKLRALADQARRLEEDLRQGRLSPEELKRRQERFQTRLLESANALQERGQSQERQAETSRGGSGPAPEAARAAAEARLLQLLREARKDARSLRLSEGQRKRLDEYYESLLTR